MNITPAIRARLVRRLRAGATIADAARAVRLPPHVVCDSVAAGARGHVFFAPLAVAHAAGLEANRRRELALVEGAARLLLAGTSIRQTAKLLRVPARAAVVRHSARSRPGGRRTRSRASTQSPMLLLDPHRGRAGGAARGARRAARR